MQVLVTVAAILVLFMVAGSLMPVGDDYYYHFRPAAQKVLSGKSMLYDGEARGYYNAPWGILLILPTLPFSIAYGQALFTVATWGAIAASIALFAPGSVLLVVPAVLNMHALDLVLRGNMDGFVLLGVTLAAWGVRDRRAWALGLGFWLMSVKPVNVVLLGLVLLWLTWQWEWWQKAIYVAPTAFSLLASLLVFGFWPIRYVQYFSSHPPFTLPQITGARMLDFFGLSRVWVWLIVVPILVLWAVSLERDDPLSSVVVTLSASLVVTPYALGGHYVLLTPVFVWLTARARWYIAAWLLTFSPLLRLLWGYDVTWVDLIYPVALFVGSVTVGRRPLKPCEGGS